MTFQDFFNKYNGKYVDFDGYYGAQCVDLVQYYNRDVVGAKVLTGAGAKDIWNTYDHDRYSAISNSPTGVPQFGDIMVWGAPYGYDPVNKIYYGHTGICISANVFSVTSFDQNYPSNTPPHSQQHNDLYKGVIGWLRPKQVTQPLTDTQKVQKITDLARQSISGDQFRDKVKSLLGI